MLKLLSFHPARSAIALIYIWFGLLKLLGNSPAETVVHELYLVTLASFISWPAFYFLLGLAEIALGIGILVKPLTKYWVILITLHMFTTFLPLLLLPQITWQTFPALTLEGQYIVKNVLVLALIYLIYRRKDS